MAVGMYCGKNMVVKSCTTSAKLTQRFLGFRTSLSSNKLIQKVRSKWTSRTLLVLIYRVYYMRCKIVYHVTQVFWVFIVILVNIESERLRHRRLWNILRTYQNTSPHLPLMDIPLRWLVLKGTNPSQEKALLRQLSDFPACPFLDEPHTAWCRD